MSRYEFPALESTGATTVAIGWDRPLATFYAQVFRRNSELGEDEAFIWEGADYCELLKAEEAMAIIRPYAELPADLASNLEIDRLKTLGNTQPNRPAIRFRAAE